MDVFGPASSIIDLPAFSQHAQSRIEHYLPQDSGNERFKGMSEQQKSWLLNRLDDLVQAGDRVFGQPQRLIEFGIWQRARYLAGSDDPAALASMQEKILGNAKPMPPTPTTIKPKKVIAVSRSSAQGAGDDVDDGNIDPILQQQDELDHVVHEETPAESVKRVTKTVISRTPMPHADNPIKPAQDNVPVGLQIYEAFPEAQHYVRWTRKADLNTLLGVRLHARGAAAEFQQTNEEVSAGRVSNNDPGPPAEQPVLILTFTYHPLISAKFTARQQRIILLSSQKLVDLRDALVCPVDALPAEREDKDEQATTGARVQRFGKEPFRGGSVFIIENMLYPDTRPGRTDMAQALLTQIAHSAARDAHVSHLLNNERPELPTYTVAPQGMQDTRLGALSLRIGQPYWFNHQGSCEHAITLDDVRLAHPRDRLPLDGPQCPYPLTTLLSRLGADKCRICNRDPATKILIDDELAGETPALCCDVCFYYMHGEGGELSFEPEERARQEGLAERAASLGGVEVIHILESMGL